MPPRSALRGWATSVSNRTILVTVRARHDDVMQVSQGGRKSKDLNCSRSSGHRSRGRALMFLATLFTSVCCREQRNQRTKDHAYESATADKLPKCEIRSEQRASA
jgi:hypothetical protein